MSKSALMNSTLEDKNNGTEEIEMMSDQSVKENCPGKESLDLRKTIVRLELLSGVCVVKTNQCIVMQKTFPAWINVKFVKVISNVYFHLLSIYFYLIIY